MRPSPTPELFREYPELRERLPWTGLARATQVHALERLRSFLRSDGIWVKRDDETNRLFGGSQARKMEFLFGDVLRSGRSRLLAFDRAGSSESLALCVFAHHFQLQCILALGGSVASDNVRRVLDLQKRLGADIHTLASGPASWWRLGARAVGRRAGCPRLPYAAWSGRRRLFGTLGYVNAAYELRRQINIGLLPEPAAVYVGVGTASMLAGLALGLELAGIRTRLIGVPVAPGRAVSARRRFDAAARLLRRRCDRFPAVRGRIPMEIRRPAPEQRPNAQQALGLLRDLEGLDLGTTAAHTMARLLEDVRHGEVEGPLLFWNGHAGTLPHGITRGRAAAAPPESIVTP